MLLARGHVPTFCACGGVANVEDAVLLREEVRALIQSEQHVVGTLRERWRGWDIFTARLSCSKATCQVDYCH
jgi:hypothetical protein